MALPSNDLALMGLDFGAGEKSRLSQIGHAQKTRDGALPWARLLEAIVSGEADQKVCPFVR
jgi:hypothetical protein